MTSFCELYQQQTAGLGPVHTNPAIFETAIFFLQESTIRPQETSKSAIQKGILLKRPPAETGLRPPPHESG